ncbi:MAG: hypothetical protein HY791_32780 [Deltaproteobacteria bacterium]|nr:hypothetical protein [Deltaproteobacteria bacterium]
MKPCGSRLARFWIPALFAGCSLACDEPRSAPPQKVEQAPRPSIPPVPPPTPPPLQPPKPVSKALPLGLGVPGLESVEKRYQVRPTRGLERVSAEMAKDYPPGDYYSFAKGSPDGLRITDEMAGPGSGDFGANIFHLSVAGPPKIMSKAGLDFVNALSPAEAIPVWKAAAAKFFRTGEMDTVRSGTRQLILIPVLAGPYHGQVGFMLSASTEEGQ